MTLEDIFEEEDNSNDMFNDFTTKKKKTKESNIALEKTLEIETLDLNVFLDQESKKEKPIEQKLSIIENLKAKENSNQETKTEEKDHSMQEAFINCSVLGFITAFAGAGWLINIINHI